VRLRSLGRLHACGPQQKDLISLTFTAFGLHPVGSRATFSRRDYRLHGPGANIRSMSCLRAAAIYSAIPLEDEHGDVVMLRGVAGKGIDFPEYSRNYLFRTQMQAAVEATHQTLISPFLIL
jgi:hypothetical protein